MPICELIKFWSQLLLGGPSIMASYVQQQKQKRQCIKNGQQLRQSFKQQQLAQRPFKKQQQQQWLLKCQSRHKLSSFNTSSSSTISIFQQQIFRISFSFSLVLLLLLDSSGVVLGEGNVGCHFVRTLCLEGSEVCFNDNIFGKCIQTTGVDVEDIEKTALSAEQSSFLATMLEELQGAGLGWDHPYVQCRIQGTLYSMQKQTQLPPNLCANLAPTPTDIDPAGVMAFVRFTPPNEDYGDLNDLLFYPPPKKQTQQELAQQLDGSGNSINTILRQLQLQDRQLRHDPLELAHFGKLDALNPQVEQPSVMDVFLQTERERIQREQLQREAELEAERKQAVRNRLEPYQIFAASEPDPEPFQRNPSKPQTNAQQDAIVPVLVPETLSESNEFYFPENYMPYKRTDNKRKQKSHSFFRELAAVEQQQPNSKDYSSQTLDAWPVAFKRIPSNAFSELSLQQQQQLEQQQQQKQWQLEQNLLRNSLKPYEEEALLSSNNYGYRHKPRKPERVFTEGGLVFVPEKHLTDNADADEEEEEQQKAAETRELFELLGFKRRERLDVKKPGPLIGPPQLENEANEVPTTTAAKEQSKSNKAETKEVLPAHIKDSNQTSKKRKFAKDHSDEDHAPHTVDTEYAHVFVKNPIDSWNDGVRIVNELANILHMQGYFTYLTVQPHDVSFRVNSNNPEHKTASDIVRFINENRGVKNNLLRRLGVTVQRAGVGDKAKLDADGGVSAARIELAEQSPDVTHIMAYMFAGAGAAAVIVIFITLILIKRHDKKRDKLGGLQTGIAGAESCSKDYQELCRARMAGKGNAAEPVPSGRITTLSKDNDRPPSSRSSTSSWSEEPALTNMDISTGHMVLSYMEDHLRNKGRLQREWEALCRYEAEPSARDAAQQAQCANFNRTGAPLPYDHSRVVLNHLANAEGLDYVNASTITDHDPRAPAYVAAQGPLPATLAHFWQMIWEQGAVVIVALCRLQENGEIACARYWPEEGAEVYHIYEVHLVSEHIWCDDYLVRSFYLKNLRTSETRTVTQFHFLSWPQGGVPAQAKALLDFRRKVNKSYRGRSCPIVVHSSHGAGRTGAYILLDLVLGRMNKGAREIDIAATLEHLRDQRAGLVATRQQFEFVLMAVAEEVHAILKALPANQSNEKRELDTKETTNGVLKEEETTIAAGVEEVATTSKMATEKQAEKHAEKEKEKDKTKVDKEKDKDAKATTTTTPAKGATTKKK